MWSSDLAALALALLTGAAPAAPATCPAAVDGARLTGVTIYDGPIAENAILAPDSSRRVGRAEVSRWRVDGVYRAGRQVNLSCAYPKRPVVVIAVSRPVRECRYTEAGERRSLSCS